MCRPFLNICLDIDGLLYFESLIGNVLAIFNSWNVTCCRESTHSQELCIRFEFYCVVLWFGIGRFTHILHDYVTGVGAILWLPLQGSNPEALWNKGYPSETHLKPKSREISFAHNLYIYFSMAQFLWNFAQSTRVKQNDWTTEKGIMGKRDFTRFGSKMTFGQIYYTLYCTAPEVYE